MSQGCVDQKFAIFYNAAINVLLYSSGKKTRASEKAAVEASTPDKKTVGKVTFENEKP
jgi:hypothetical protein